MCAEVLLVAMVPFEPEVMPDIARTCAYFAAGQRDRMLATSNIERLAEILREAGAEVHLRRRHVGHDPTDEEVGEAEEWLSGFIEGDGRGRRNRW